MDRRVAIVVGVGYAGIGASTADRLARRGFSLAITDIDFESASRVMSRLPGGQHSAYRLDVSDEPEVASVITTIEEQMGPATALICCAGIMITPTEGPPEIADIETESWDRTFDVNVRGAFLCVREFLRHRKRRPISDGRIVLISSVAAQLGGYRGSPDYIASKAAVIGLTKIAARQVAGMGMTANCIAPGFIETPMFRAAVPVGTEAPLLRNVPLGRLGKPDEVAAAIEFLVSRDAGYISGSTIDVNGGYRMQ
jgi:NAD(P)-dependent dehydrogenase (short-subunit alcohol dehydrogenase family)